MIRDASPTLMARDLVARHSDIGFVQGYVLSFFGRAPSREKIEQYRQEHLAAQERAQDKSRAAESDDKRKLRERQRNASRRYRERKAAA